MLMTFMQVADIFAIIIFSIIGANIGINKELNVVGVCCLAFLTSFGGGVVRDMIISELPLIFSKYQIVGIIPIVVGIIIYMKVNIIK